MHDFFTELDSDITSTKKMTHTPKTPGENTKIIPSIPKPHTHPHQKRPETKGKSFTQKSNSTIPNHVNEMRAQMMTAGVVTIVFKADEKTRALLGHLKLETRGFVYMEEVREIHKMIIKKARASYEDTLKDIPDIEEKDFLKIIRRDMEIFLTSKIGRNPVIIPIIIYV
ncbi:MAG: hypothetical protein PHQ95_03575 [Candidatus Gracilibacteria bacterium]|nr:hypothetical protein [Candidatus Gracilibacteria bacterium]